MTKTLAINAGSSSLKWQLYEMPEETVLAKGLVERIGLRDSVIRVQFDGKEESYKLDVKDHVQAVKLLVEDMMRLEIIKEISEITGIGHRVVAGGESFKQSVKITDEVLEQIESLAELAPLHNPANAAGIRAFKELLPTATAVAVFDTAFHTTLPEKAYRYPLPTHYYKDFAVRKYGAHGTSHMYVSQQAAKFLDKPIEDTKLITAHIGNGVSLSAIRGGISVDTTMGFTPLAGLMMGTRVGDMDASVIPYLLGRSEKFKDAQQIIDEMNQKSGLLGISENSSDMRDIVSAMEKGDDKSRLAFEMYIDRIQKYIGSYLAVLNGADALVFTAGVGENGSEVREAVVNGLSWFGLALDPAKNIRGAVGEISMQDSKVKVLVIPTDEELVIARDVEKIQKQEEG